MQRSGSFEGIPWKKCIVWVGNIMTPDYPGGIFWFSVFFFGGVDSWQWGAWFLGCPSAKKDALHETAKMSMVKFAVSIHRGWNPTQSYRDSFISHFFKIPVMNQSGFHVWCQPRVVLPLLTLWSFSPKFRLKLRGCKLGDFGLNLIWETKTCSSADT